MAPMYSLECWEEMARESGGTPRRGWGGGCANTDLGGVDLHGVEGVDGDEDVAHVRVDLVPAVATLELLRHLVLE